MRSVQSPAASFPSNMFKLSTGREKPVNGLDLSMIDWVAVWEKYARSPLQLLEPSPHTSVPSL